MEIITAYLHLLSIMVFAGLLAAECMLCNEHLQPAHVRLLTRVDAAYVATAVVVLLTGGLMLIGFDHHVWYTLTHPVFWAKLALFMVIGLIAIYPSFQFQRWHRAIETGQERILTTRDIRRTRRVLFLEVTLLAIVPLLAVWLVRSDHPPGFRP